MIIKHRESQNRIKNNIFHLYQRTANSVRKYILKSMDVSYRRIINKGIIENALTNRYDIFHLSKTTNKREAVYDKKKHFITKFYSIPISYIIPLKIALIRKIYN